MRFYLNYRFLFFLLLTAGFPAARAQLNLLTKKMDKAILLSAPSVGSYTLQDPAYRHYLKLKNGYPDERAAWIVYSDRSNNTTYQNPGNENQPLSSLNFMQACFVIGEKDGYLELAEYVPGVNMSKSRKIISNPKYLGWVHKSALLLWNRALKDNLTNSFFKVLTAFGTERIFTILPQHVEGDSIRIFSDPFLERRQAASAMESLFYLYKESVDGNEYLIGPDPEFLPEQAAGSGLGWISKDLLRVWGTKGFITLDPALEGHIPFYPFMAGSLPGNSASSPVAIATASASLQGDVLSNIFPILRYSTSADSKAQIATGLLTDVFDKGNNGILNLAGETLSYDAIRAFGMKSAALNIVLVVAGGEKNRQYINHLNTLIESEGWKHRAGKYFNSIKMAAVVYGDYGSHCRPSFTPLTSDLQEIAAFLSAQKRETLAGCDNGNYYQAVYQGIAEATKMLRNYRDESNIILLYGAGTDESGGIGQAIAGLTATNARLLVFQTHNIPNESAYVQFVGAAKDLISKSAYNIIELKRRYLVSNTYSNVVTGKVAYTRGSDTTGRVMFLDYPARALSQGYILFPDNGENMPPHYLAAYLDSLITGMGTDNRRIDNALHSALAQSGTGDTRVKNAFAAYFPEYAGKRLPAAFLKANTLRNQKFLIPVRTSLAGSSLQSAQTGLSSGVLLSRKEFTAFIRDLSALGGAGTYRDKEAVVRQILRAVEKAQEGQARITKPLRELTFTEAMGFVTGYFPMDAVWVQTTLDAYRTSSSIPVLVGTAFLEESRRKADWLRDQYNNPDLQYPSNGNVYYLVKSPDLPAAPLVDAGGEGYFENQARIPEDASVAPLATGSVGGTDDPAPVTLNGSETAKTGGSPIRRQDINSAGGPAEGFPGSAASDEGPGDPVTGSGPRGKSDHEPESLDIGNIHADLGELKPEHATTSERSAVSERRATSPTRIAPEDATVSESTAGGNADTGTEAHGYRRQNARESEPTGDNMQEESRSGAENAVDDAADVSAGDSNGGGDPGDNSGPIVTEDPVDQVPGGEKEGHPAAGEPVDFRGDLRKISPVRSDAVNEVPGKGVGTKPRIKKAAATEAGMSDVREDLGAANGTGGNTPGATRLEALKETKPDADIQTIRNDLEEMFVETVEKEAGKSGRADKQQKKKKRKEQNRNKAD